MKTSILIVGPPGCGKTEAVYAMAERLKLPCHVEISSQDDPVDMTGVIVYDEHTGTSKKSVPEYWQAASKAPHVLFFDEITTGTAEQIVSCLRATSDRRELNGCTLHKDTVVIAACNPVWCAAGSARELPAPVLSRFRHVHVGHQGAVDFMGGGPGLVLDFPYEPPIPGMPRIVASYLVSNPDAAMATREQIESAVAEQVPFPCPRQWLRWATEEGDLSRGLPEHIGTAAAAAFLTWYTTQDLTSPVEILAGRDFRVPTRGDGVMVTSHAVAGLLGRTPTSEALGNAMKWFKRAADEGNVANCIVAVKDVLSVVGTAKASRYPECLAPFGEALRLA